MVGHRLIAGHRGRRQRVRRRRRALRLIVPALHRRWLRPHRHRLTPIHLRRVGHGRRSSGDHRGPDLIREHVRGRVVHRQRAAIRSDALVGNGLRGPAGGNRAALDHSRWKCWRLPVGMRAACRYRRARHAAGGPGIHSLRGRRCGGRCLRGSITAGRAEDAHCYEPDEQRTPAMWASMPQVVRPPGDARFVTAHHPKPREDFS